MDEEPPFNALEFARVVQARYSCYSFDQSKPVDDEILKQCLELTRAAPRVKNTHPWTAIVVRSVETRAKLINAMDKIHKSKVASAPVCIVFAAETDGENVMMKNAPDFLRAALPGLMGGSAESWAFKQTSFAAAVFMLAATAHGLQTCAMERFTSTTAVADAVGLPSSYSVPLVVAVGYEAEKRTEKGEGADFKQAVVRLYLDEFKPEQGYSTKPGVTNPVKFKPAKPQVAGLPSRPATAPAKPADAKAAGTGKPALTPAKSVSSKSLTAPKLAADAKGSASERAKSPSTLERAKSPSAAASSAERAPTSSKPAVSEGASHSQGTEEPKAAGSNVLTKLARRLSWRKGDKGDAVADDPHEA